MNASATSQANQVLDDMFSTAQINFGTTIPQLQDQLGQLDAAYQTNNQNIFDNKQFIIQQQQSPDIYSIEHIQPLTEQLNLLISKTIQINSSLENLQKSRFLLQIFLDFVAAQHFLISLKSDFLAPKYCIPPNFRYQMRNPFRRAQSIFILKQLLIFKTIKYTNNNDQAELVCSNSLYSNTNLRLKSEQFNARWNGACTTVKSLIQEFQKVQIDEKYDIFDECRVVLSQVQRGQVPAVFTPEAVTHTYSSEFYKLISFLQTPQPNFPTAHQIFTTLRALEGDCWRYKILVFEAIFMMQVVGIDTEFDLPLMRDIKEEDSFNFSQRMIDSKLLGAKQFFDRIQNILISILRLAGALCGDQELFQQITRFSVEYLLKVFSARLIRKEHATVVCYVASLFKRFAGGMKAIQIARVKLDFANSRFGYPSNVNKSSQCKVQTFLDHFRSRIVIPQTQNYFIQKIGDQMKNKEIDFTEYVDLNMDLNAQIGFFKEFLTYEDFGLVYQEFDFIDYLRQRILSDESLEYDKQRVIQIKSRIQIAQLSLQTIQEAIMNRQQLDSKLASDLQHFRDPNIKHKKDVTEADIIEKYKSLDTVIVTKIQQCLIQYVNYDKQYNATDVKQEELELKQELILPNSLVHKLVPKLPISLILISEYNNFSKDSIDFDQETMSQYFQELRENNVNYSKYLNLLTPGQLDHISQPWPDIIFDSIQSDMNFQQLKNEQLLKKQQLNIQFNRNFLDPLLNQIFEKLFQQQIVLEEIVFQMDPLLTMQLQLNLQTDSFKYLLKNHEQSPVLVLDHLQIVQLQQDKLNRLFILSSQKFSTKISDSYEYPIQIQLQFLKIIKIFNDQIAQRIQLSNTFIIQVLDQNLQQFKSNMFHQIKTMIFPNTPIGQELPLIAPFATPQDFNLKSFKILETVLQEELNLKLSKKSLSETLQHLNLQSNGLPIGFSTNVANTSIYNNSYEIYAIPLCKQAFQAINNIFVGVFLACAKFSKELQPKIAYSTQISFKNLEIQAQQLLLLQIEALAAACRHIWSHCRVFDFHNQKVGIFNLHECAVAQVTLLDAHSTPSHAEFVGEILEKNLQFFSSAKQRELLVAEFLATFIAHIARFPLRDFETSILAKTELFVYEKHFEKAGFEVTQFRLLRAVLSVQNQESEGDMRWQQGLKLLNRRVWGE
ncbi:hypothetical protein SS50377_28000 [Spironucleus salmonicida]|uniref:Uncharacterized protein n=1 Tax=Spironucleus salmonicida TaxID=348837 RepID=V6LE52_9EUKA|nr:hypothetical protein SS50377_28000 [Spironucleus salmonicida]|eukprot:EST42558.1 Hypothetical protein SS50377_17873 [Spironucleus salmonicida]